MAAVGFEEFSAPPGSELALPPLFGGHILESELETEVEFVSGGLGGSGLRERDEEEEAARGRRRRQRELNRRKYQALGRRCREIEQVGSAASVSGSRARPCLPSSLPVYLPAWARRSCRALSSGAPDASPALAAHAPPRPQPKLFSSVPLTRGPEASLLCSRTFPGSFASLKSPRPLPQADSPAGTAAGPLVRIRVEQQARDTRARCLGFFLSWELGNPFTVLTEGNTGPGLGPRRLLKGGPIRFA